MGFDPGKPTNAKAKKVVRKKTVLAAPTPDQADRATPTPRQHHRTRVQTTVDHRVAKAEANARAKTPDQADRERAPVTKQHDAAAVAGSVASSRRKFIIRKRQEGFKKALKAPVDPKMIRANANTGAGPTMFHGSIDRHGIHVTPMAAIQPRTVDLSKAPIIQRAIADAFNFPSSAVPSMYDTGAGIAEAAQGRPARIKRIASDLNKSDPVLNTAVAGFDAATGDSKNAKKRIKAAGKAASEHPGFTAIEVAGAKGAIGRGITHVGKTGILGKAAKQAVSTERAPRTLPGTSLREDRTYSPDAIRKGRQVATEKVRDTTAKVLRKRAVKAEAKGNPVRAVELHQAAAKVDSNQPITEREIQKRVDEHVDARETIRRRHRAAVVGETRKSLKNAKADDLGPVASLVSQGITHADVADLRAYATELESEYDSLGNAGKRANKQLRDGIAKAVKKVESGKADLRPIEKLAKDYRKAQADREAALHARGMLPEEHAQLAAAKPYAVRRMGATWDDAAKQLVDHKGDVIPLSHIHAHMAAHGEPVPSFLSQGPNARGGKNFYQSGSRPPHIDSTPRTGEATRKGTFDADPETLVEQAARQQGLKDQFDTFHSFLDEFGLKGKGGHIKTLTTRKQVESAARDAMHDEHGVPRPGAIKWVPVRVNPFGGSHEQLMHMLEGNDDAQALVHGGGLHDALTHALGGEDAWKTFHDNPTAGDWALVPEAAAKRLQSHVKVLNPDNLAKLGQKVNSTFRKTVLATSVPWITGNVGEGLFRSALAKAGPLSYMTGKAALKAGDEEFGARTVGGGHFGSAERQDVHLNVDGMDPGAVKEFTRAMGAIWRTPGPKHAAKLWNSYTHLVFNTVNRALETQIQTAMLGKAIRKNETLMTPRLMHLMDDASDMASRGELDRNTAVSLGRELDIMYGKYGKWSPTARKAVALYTPFIAWTINATYFLLRTLPRDHPVATALIASMENADTEWRREHGLDKFVSGAAPGWLQGSIPLPGGGHLRAPVRYTPFGLGSDPLGTYAGSVLPQFSGALAAGKGKDWQGNDLKDTTDTGKVKAAVESFLTSTIPLLSTGQQIAKKGPMGIVDSTVGKVAPSKPKSRTVRRTPAAPSWGGSSSGGSSSGGAWGSGGGSGGAWG